MLISEIFHIIKAGRHLKGHYHACHPYVSGSVISIKEAFHGKRDIALVQGLGVRGTDSGMLLLVCVEYDMQYAYIYAYM